MGDAVHSSIPRRIGGSFADRVEVNGLAAFDFEAGFSIDVDVLPDDVTVVRARGELDLASVDILTERIEALAAQGPTRIILDGSELGFVDSTGLGALVRSSDRIHQEGSAFVVVPSRPLERLLEISGMESFFQVFPAVETAARAIRDDLDR